MKQTELKLIQGGVQDSDAATPQPPKKGTRWWEYAWIKEAANPRCSLGEFMQSMTRSIGMLIRASNVMDAGFARAH